MKDVKKKKRVLDGIDVASVVLCVAKGGANFVHSGDWKWICWMVIVLYLGLRAWLTLDALRRKEDEVEMWRVLYQKEANKFLDLAWENEQMRVKHNGEDEG